jgi:hypothetical protein
MISGILTPRGHLTLQTWHEAQSHKKGLSHASFNQPHWRKRMIFLGVSSDSNDTGHPDEHRPHWTQMENWGMVSV